MEMKFFLYLIVIFSATFHEFAHGWAAYRLGDNTAKDGGRLTLNPLVHIDLVGTILIPIFLLFTSGIFIGWAKPVPYNPYNLKDKKFGSLKVGLAGPLANLLLALILGLPLRFSSALMGLGASSIFLELIGLIAYVNVSLALFNLIPFPPLDGSKVFGDLFPKQWSYVMRLGPMGIFFAFFLAFFILPALVRSVFWIITGQAFF